MRATTSPAVERGHTRDRRKAWVSDRVLDYSPVKTCMPVVEESITQTGESFKPIRLALAYREGVGVLRLQISFPSVGLTLMEPGHTGFWLCSPETRGVRVNGEEASALRLFLTGQDSYHIHGAERNVFAGTFQTEPFRRTLAALQGIDPEDVDLSVPFLTLRPDHAEHLRRLVATATHDWTREQRTGTESEVDRGQQIIKALAEIFLQSSPPPPAATRRVTNLARIARRAEEFFMERQHQSFSLADLCAASGAGKSALYSAFHTMYDTTPLRHFHLRRLGIARTDLLKAPPRRGGVKRAALGAGLTELGRFSVEYRSLFGELPSVTLRHSLD